MNEDVRITTEPGGIVVITLNRAAEGNVLTQSMGEAMLQAVGSLAPETKVVVIRAEGADFCTGRQSAMPASGARATAVDIRGAVADPVLDFYAKIRAVPIPVISAVRGRAEGVGCALAALADITVAAEDARFSIPEMNRDIPPLLVMTALADRIPRAALARLVLTRDAVSGVEAQVIGLAGIVTAPDQLDAEVARLCARLTANSVPVLRAVKSFLNMSGEMSFAALVR
jgi:enoyl-CoA hydratase